MRRRPAFADNLEAALRLHGIDKAELARRIRVKPSTITRYTSGQRIPGGPELVAIAKVLAVNPEALLGADAIEVAPAQPPPPRGRPRARPADLEPTDEAPEPPRRRTA